MKTNNFYRICIFLAVISLATACVQEDDFTVPSPGGTLPPDAGVEANITIPQVKSLLSGYSTDITSDLIVEGYVVSSDASGNFYKELYLQDHPTDPTAAIRLAVNSSNLYMTYEMGRKLFVHLKGLAISKDNNDVITIGQRSGEEISGIGESVLTDYITKSDTIAEITGSPMLFSQLSELHIGMYVSVSDTQFQSDELGLSFVDAADLYDTRRTLVSCEEGSTFLLETSAFASFSQIIVPDASGTVSGIVTRDYSGDYLVLVLNEATDMEYAGERCE